MWKTLQEHPIRIIALLFAAVLLAFLAYMAVWLTNVLSSSEWCGKALQAERISAQNFGGLTACIELLKIQLEALSDVIKMVVGSFSFGLVVLVVVVLAGSRASGKLPGGMEIDIGPVAAAAAAAATVATTVAANGAKPPPAPVPVGPPPEPPKEANGPRMPEPPKP